MTASIAAEMKKDVRVMQLVPRMDLVHAGPMIRRIRATKSALDACSNANNTTKLRQQAVPRPAWPIDLRL
jgi:hypothetical protein